MRRIIGFALVAVVLILIGIGNFSEVSTRYACSGMLGSDAQQRRVEAFLKINEYRWWVGLWSDSDGDLTLEIPGELVEHVRLRKFDVLDRFQLLTFARELGGEFSILSGRLYVETLAGTFRGECSKMP